jgi:WD40 repeat protein
MPPPRPPSRVEPVSIPVFGISWLLQDTKDGGSRSYTAYTGGGGSARTGVRNLVVLQQSESAEDITISTGDLVGLALLLYQNPTSQRICLLVALGSEVRRYSVPDAVECGSCVMAQQHPLNEIEKESCCAVAVNAMADRWAAGCDSGLIFVFALSEDEGSFGTAPPLYTCRGHSKSICALSFSVRGGKLLSSAKDGTARVWDDTEADGTALAELVCDCTPEHNAKKTTAKPSTTPPQILVRGCAFADLDGKVVLTVASARRGAAFLAQWLQSPTDSSSPSEYTCQLRTACSPCPVSAMSLSQDGRLLALGAVDGSIRLWSVLDWAELRCYKEVHDLPVTCIAARPFEHVMLASEANGSVPIHAKSASADGQMACLTLVRKVPRQSKPSSRGGGGGGGLMILIHRLMITSFWLWLLSPLARDAVTKCGRPTLGNEWPRCVLDRVIVAPSTRPGIASMPM